MPPEIDDSNTGGYTSKQLADYIGTRKTSGKADNPAPPKRRQPNLIENQ
jgi:hypothetical protein